MQKDELLALAERAEALSGPDREIDRAIAKAIGKGRWFIAGSDRWRYTASLDAAETLVPEGCGWLAGWGQTRPDEPMGGARITRNARFVGYCENYDEIAVGEAATPALALCAAALRALAGGE